MPMSEVSAWSDLERAQGVRARISLLSDSASWTSRPRWRVSFWKMGTAMELMEWSKFEPVV